MTQVAHRWQVRWLERLDMTYPDSSFNIVDEEGTNDSCRHGVYVYLCSQRILPCRQLFVYHSEVAWSRYASITDQEVIDKKRWLVHELKRNIRRALVSGYLLCNNGCGLTPIREDWVLSNCL
jgi:hypothetical protein